MAETGIGNQLISSDIFKCVSVSVRDNGNKTFQDYFQEICAPTLDKSVEQYLLKYGQALRDKSSKENSSTINRLSQTFKRKIKKLLSNTTIPGGIEVSMNADYLHTTEGIPPPASRCYIRINIVNNGIQLLLVDRTAKTADIIYQKDFSDGIDISCQ